MKTNKINFKQGKYIMPLIVYVLTLIIGYVIIDTCNLELEDTSSGNLKTTDYLSSALPDAKTDSLLGSKMDNTERRYGKITDLSGIESVENDRDSVRKKEEYESQYNKKEADLIKQQQAEQEELKKLKSMQNRVRDNSARQSSSSNDFVAPVSDSQIARLQRQRRNQSWEEMNRNLSGITASSDDDEIPSRRSTTYRANIDRGTSVEDYQHDSSAQKHRQEVAKGANDDESPEKVTKKTKEISDYFNTIGMDKEKNKLISAIIDEEVKAVDGSRVRLRLLDDIEIGNTTVQKGTYLYAAMSGFGKQRVKGKVESIFFEEEIIKVSLSIYDTDGLEGLYVPMSSFRETSKEIASSATQGSNNLTESTTSGTGIKSWATQAMTNATQKAMSALGKGVKKNRVKLKYGTKVYLVDSSSNRSKTKL